MSHRPSNSVRKQFKNTCPCCHVNIDGHASSSGEVLEPDNGSIALCSYCMTLLIIEDGYFTEVTHEQYEAFCQEDPNFKKLVEAARVAALDMIFQRKMKYGSPN
jgi:hypothetical protein